MRAFSPIRAHHSECHSSRHRASSSPTRHAPLRATVECCRTGRAHSSSIDVFPFPSEGLFQRASGGANTTDDAAIHVGYPWCLSGFIQKGFDRFRHSPVFGHFAFELPRTRRSEAILAHFASRIGRCPRRLDETFHEKFLKRRIQRSFLHAELLVGNH